MAIDRYASLDFGLVDRRDEESFYGYADETINYFQGLGINIERIIENTARVFRSRMDGYSNNLTSFVGDVAEVISRRIAGVLKDDYECDLRELAEYSLRATLIAGNYITNGGGYERLGDYILDEGMKEYYKIRGKA